MLRPGGSDGMTAMTHVLILGGTGWLSGRIAQAWLAAGAAVTCVARGARPAPQGAELVIADRSQPGAYDHLALRDWDEIVEISSIPEHVAAAAAALAGCTRHWTYVSSVSVYARNDQPGADEFAALSVPAIPGEEYDYSRAKAAAEASVTAVVGNRLAIVRPGLIVGPGDPTDRFGYWIARFALAGDEAVLTPALDGLRAQVIDVDDLVEFTVARGAESWAGVVNAVGDSVPLADLLARAREIAGHTGDLVEADDTWLEQRGVAQWMGPHSLPLWLPRDMTGFAARSHEAFRAAGGRLRPIDETLSRVMADERTRGLDRERANGLTRDEEIVLLRDFR